MNVKYNSSCRRLINVDTHPFHRHALVSELMDLSNMADELTYCTFTVFALDWKTFPPVHGSTYLAESGARGWHEVPSTVYQPLSHPNRIFWKTEKLLSDGCRIGAIRSRTSTHCFSQISLSIFLHSTRLHANPTPSALELEGSSVNRDLIGGRSV